jgi:predicted dehydrogenase
VSKDNQIEIGVIGLGYWGPNWVRNILKHPDYSLAWIVDANPERIKSHEKQYGLNQSQVHGDLESAMKVNVPDLVLVATPPSTHLELGKSVLIHGSNLIVEKPIGISNKEAAELISLGKSKNLQIFVDHTYIFTPLARKIKEIIGNKEIGELQFIISSRLNLGLIQKDVDVIRDLAVHDLALFDFFLNEKPESVSANVATHAPSKIASTASLNLNYKHELISQIGVSWNSPVKVRIMIISGSKQSILWDDTNQSEKLKIYEASANLDISDPNRYISYSLGDTLIPKVDSTEAIYLELNHMKDVLLNKVSPINGYEHIERVNAVLSGLEQSVQNDGQKVRI